VGYTTYVTGEFTITPPLTWPEFKDSKYAPDNLESRREPPLVLQVEEETVTTELGPLLRLTATALVMREIDEYRAYDLLEKVQEAIDSFPGHTFTGYLACDGEQSSDIWRVVIRDGRAVRVEPRIVWPDDDA
jgi:Family of unknown function (DUF6205)